MRRVLLAVVLSVGAFAPLTAQVTDWSGIIARAEKSVMFVESGCTAFVIDTARKYVLTAAHCDTPGKTMWVDRVEARIVARDQLKDLLVLEVPHLDPARPALRLAKNPTRGQNVMSIGYGMALERPFFRIAHVSDDAVTIPNVEGGPFIGLDAAFVGGQSGGPVVDHEGRVVMIVQRASNTVGIGVGADTIRDRVGRFFGK
jgi:S1-C subfamily serine protease